MQTDTATVAPPADAERRSLIGLDRAALTAVLADLGQPAYRAGAGIGALIGPILQHINQRRQQNLQRQQWQEYYRWQAQRQAPRRTDCRWNHRGAYWEGRGCR